MRVFFFGIKSYNEIIIFRRDSFECSAHEASLLDVLFANLLQPRISSLSLQVLKLSCNQVTSGMSEMMENMLLLQIRNHGFHLIDPSKNFSSPF